jgi:hypothetical protein
VLSGDGGIVAGTAGAVAVAVAKDAIRTSACPGRLAGEGQMRRMWLMVTSS